MPENLLLASERPIHHDSDVDDGIKQCLKIGQGNSFITPPDVDELDIDIDLSALESLTAEESLEKRDFDSNEIDAWAEALKTPFFQIQGYHQYVKDGSIYKTHQGVKGNEFERVMVIMDDDEAGGFMFSYEQYFGAKELSEGTISKLKAGEETGLDRTRRLFYVTSTRAKNSLAHIIYTSDVIKVRENLLRREFAAESEVILK